MLSCSSSSTAAILGKGRPHPHQTKHFAKGANTGDMVWRAPAPLQLARVACRKRLHRQPTLWDPWLEKHYLHACVNPLNDFLHLRGTGETFDENWGPVFTEHGRLALPIPSPSFLLAKTFQTHAYGWVPVGVLAKKSPLAAWDDPGVPQGRLQDQPRPTNGLLDAGDSSSSGRVAEVCSPSDATVPPNSPNPMYVQETC